MKISGRIKKFMNRNNPELIAGDVADAYLERKENKEKDPMDHTADEIMQILKTHPDIEKAILACHNYIRRRFLGSKDLIIRKY